MNQELLSKLKLAAEIMAEVSEFLSSNQVDNDDIYEAIMQIAGDASVSLNYLNEGGS